MLEYVMVKDCYLLRNAFSIIDIYWTISFNCTLVIKKRE